MRLRDTNRKEDPSNFPATLPATVNPQDEIPKRPLTLRLDTSTNEDTFAIRDYLRVFFKHRVLIGITAVVVFGLAALYCVVATRMYGATSSLKIGVYQPLLPNGDYERSMYLQSTSPDYFNTQTEMLTSLTLADKVLTDHDPDHRIANYSLRRGGLISKLLSVFRSEKDSEVSAERSYRHSLAALQAYLRVVSIAPVRKTSLVKVTAITPDAALSQEIANAHAQAFIDLLRSQRQQTATDNLRFLNDQAAELADKVAQAERNIAAYAEEHSIVAINKDENITVKGMSELSEMLTKATEKRIKSEALLNEARSGSGVNSTSLDDDSTRDIRTALGAAESEYAMLNEKFTPSYPKMVQLRARISALRADLLRGRKQSIAAVEAEFNADKKAEEELQRQLEIQKSKTFELSRHEVQYNIMSREYESLKQLHQTVLEQLKQAQMNVENAATNVTLVDQAALPVNPMSPRVPLVLLLSFLAGPVVGIGLSLLIEVIDDSLKTPDEVERMLSLPALGIVPSFTLDDPTRKEVPPAPVYELTDIVPEEKELPLPFPDLATGPENECRNVALLHNDLIVLDLPRSQASEAYRTIRTALLLSSADDPPHVVLVTSAKKSEGKTTLATNLAVALAQAGKRTVIVDADLRRPALRRFFASAPGHPGLVELLTSQSSLEDVVLDTPVRNLWLVTAGTIPPNPAELLSSRKMIEIVDQLEQTFDFVIIDSSPILPVTDPVILSRIVDGVILVVRAHETGRQLAREARNKLRHVDARILGVVLNDVDYRRGDYYYYRDSYSYYGADEDEPMRAAGSKG